ncbi:MAG: hypothetical protein WCH75_02550 [Candidatus Binatia bacterium]|jgi:hypothetical protein
MLEKTRFMSEEMTEDFLCREQTRSLFGQPDVTLVSEYLQVHRSTMAYTPEMRLIASVLEDAIDCYLKYFSAKTRRGKRLFGEAEQWIFSRNDDWLFSCDNVCEMLKLDPDYIRRVLKHTTQRNLPGQLPEGIQPTVLRLAS